MQKTLYTLRINEYSPQICELTFPLMKHYAAKIGADFCVINERNWPNMPITFEKFQVAKMAAANDDDWAIFFDADTLINPEMFDPTEHMGKDTVAHNGKDMAGIRWTYDPYFRRDGRHIGSCTWCVIASDWTVEDLWHRPGFESDVDASEIVNSSILSNIHVTIGEHLSGTCQPHHLIDDYLLSRNIARFGLKFTTIGDICKRLELPPIWLWHKYTISEAQKVREMLAVLSTPQHTPAFAEQGEIINGPAGPLMRTGDGRVIQPCGNGWGLMTSEQAQEYRQKWGL